MARVAFNTINNKKSFNFYLDNKQIKQKDLKCIDLSGEEHEIKRVSAFALRTRFWFLLILVDFFTTLLGGIKFGEWFRNEGYQELKFKCKFFQAEDAFVNFHVDLDRAEPVIVESNARFEIIQMEILEDVKLKKRITNYPKIAIFLLLSILAAIFLTIAIALAIKHNIF